MVELAKKHPGQFVYFANEVADLDEAPDVIRRHLKRGAIGIGEQKFRVGCDSRWLDLICGVAEEFGVPVLMHHQPSVYNTGIENFHKTLDKFPRVNFIGHAQTWWGNVDAKHQQKVLYPKGRVKAHRHGRKAIRKRPIAQKQDMNRHCNEADARW